MGSAIWPLLLEPWLGCAIYRQQERPPSRVGAVLKRSTPENCPKARRPSFCKKISRVATPLLAIIRSQRNLPLRSLSVRRPAILCFYYRASCNWNQSHRDRIRVKFPPLSSFTTCVRRYPLMKMKPPQRSHAWTFYVQAPGGFTIDVLASLA